MYQVTVRTDASGKVVVETGSGVLAFRGSGGTVGEALQALRDQDRQDAERSGVLPIGIANKIAQQLGFPPPGY